MLVLSRKPGESLLIGDEIRITLIRFGGGNSVRIGIEAPLHLAVLRTETVVGEQRAAALDDLATKFDGQS